MFLNYMWYMFFKFHYQPLLFFLFLDFIIFACKFLGKVFCLDVSLPFDIFKEYGCYDIYKETENDTFDEYDVFVGDYDECVEYVKNLKLETINS